MRRLGDLLLLASAFIVAFIAVGILALWLTSLHF